MKKLQDRGLLTKTAGKPFRKHGVTKAFAAGFDEDATQQHISIGNALENLGKSKI